MKLKYFIVLFPAFIFSSIFSASVLELCDPDSFLSLMLERSCSGFLSGVIGDLNMQSRKSFLDRYRAIWEEEQQSLEFVHGVLDSSVERRMVEMFDALKLSADKIEKVFLTDEEAHKLTTKAMGILRTNLNWFFCKRKKVVSRRVVLFGEVPDELSCSANWKTGFQILFSDSRLKKTATKVDRMTSLFGWFDAYDIGGWPS